MSNLVIKINQNDYIKIFSWILFLLSQIISLPLILIGIWNKKHYAVVQLIIFFSILAFLYPPTGDLYRFYNNLYINFKGINYFEIFDFYIFDILWPSLLYVLANCDLPFQLNQSISCILQMGITYYILIKCNCYQLSKNKFFCIVTGSLIYNGFWTPIEMRFYVGVSLFLLALFFISKRKYLFCFCFFILSFLVHFSFIVFALIFLLCVLFKKVINWTSSILLLFVLMSVLFSLGGILEDQGFSKSIYITGSTDWTEGASKLFIMFRNWLIFLPAVVLIYFLIKNSLNSIFFKFSLILIVFTISTIPFPDLNTRFKILSCSALWLYFVLNYQNLKITWFKSFFLCSAAAFIINSALSYRAITLGKYQDLIYPVPYILYNDEYSDNWIQNRIDDGNVFMLN